MLQKPTLSESDLLQQLEREYGVEIDQIEFLPLGADLNTLVYHGVSNPPLFIKLRKNAFQPASVLVPSYLAAKNIEHIIPANQTLHQTMWTQFLDYTVMVYPYVEGVNGFETTLSDEHRIQFGNVIRRLHTTDFPSELVQSVRVENFSAEWCTKLRQFLKMLDGQTFVDSIAAELAQFLREKQTELARILTKTDHLAHILRQRSHQFVLCHGDCHGWNLLIDKRQNLFVVDWDTLIFAPKERDLMFVGIGIGGNGQSMAEEEALFFQGYGKVGEDHDVLGYYRYHRIIEDIGVTCEQLFLTAEGGNDRILGLDLVKDLFRPKQDLAIALSKDKTGLEQ